MLIQASWAFTASPGKEVGKGTRACQVDFPKRRVHRIVYRFPWPRPQLVVEIFSISNGDPHGLARRIDAHAQQDRSAGEASRWPPEGSLSKVSRTPIPYLPITESVFVAVEDLDGIIRGCLVIIALLEKEKPLFIPLQGKSQKFLLAFSCQARDLRRRWLTPVQQPVWLKESHAQVRVTIKEGDRIPVRLARYLKTARV